MHKQECLIYLFFHYHTHLHALGDAFSIRKDLGQVLGAQDVPQGGLGQ